MAMTIKKINVLKKKMETVPLSSIQNDIVKRKHTAKIILKYDYASCNNIYYCQMLLPI